MRISDWSSDVCSSDLLVPDATFRFCAVLSARRCAPLGDDDAHLPRHRSLRDHSDYRPGPGGDLPGDGDLAAQGSLLKNTNRIAAQRKRPARSEEHTSELQSLMRNSYAVFCLKKKTQENMQ